MKAFSKWYKKEGNKPIFWYLLYMAIMIALVIFINTVENIQPL